MDISFYYKTLFAAFLCLASFTTQAQTNFTISGTVSDFKTGEALIGATIQIEEDENIGAISNEYGFYSLSLPQGNYTILCTYLGYNIYKNVVTIVR